MLFTSNAINNVNTSYIALAEGKIANIVPMVLLRIESAVVSTMLVLSFKNK